MKKKIEENKVIYNVEEVKTTKSWNSELKGILISDDKIKNPKSKVSVLPKMPEFADLRTNEIKHSQNPFIFENDKEKKVLTWELPTKTKKKIIGNSDLGVVNMSSGELAGGNFLWEAKNIDEEQFSKIYLSEMHHLYGLKKTGLVALSYLLNKLEPNKDLVYIYPPDMMKFCNYKVKKTCYTGLKELIKAELIAPSLQPGFWYINPRVIFNGNRLTLIKTYTKNGFNEQQDNLQMLGEG
jgi:hypothetical protein